MEVVSKVVKGVGKKSGKPFIRVDIPLTENYTKVVFLEEVEKALLENTYVEL